MVTPQKKPIGPLGQKVATVLRNALTEYGQKADVASMAGMKPQQLSDILNERRVPTGETIARLLAAMGKDWAWLDRQGLSPQELYPPSDGGGDDEPKI
jgi:transcriptional regulator with XRE-family HTH domain